MAEELTWQGVTAKVENLGFSEEDEGHILGRLAPMSSEMWARYLAGSDARVRAQLRTLLPAGVQDEVIQRLAGLELAIGQLATAKATSIHASGASQGGTMTLLQQLDIVFAAGCPCNRQAEHPHPKNLTLMKWAGSESSKPNMELACKVLQSWLADEELVAVAVPETPWLTCTLPHFTLSGSKTDIVVLDMELLKSVHLSEAEYQDVIKYNPPAAVLQKVIQCMVLLYECKPTTGRGRAHARAKWQCVVQYLAVNNMRAASCGIQWTPAQEVEVYGGDCTPEETIGVHSVFAATPEETIGVHSVFAADPTQPPSLSSPKTRRHLHLRYPHKHAPALVRQSAQRVKDAMRSQRGGVPSGAQAMDVDAPLAGPSGGRLPSSAAARMPQTPFMGPLEAGALGIQGLYPRAMGEACSEESASSDWLDVPEQYHEQAVFNAACHEALELHLNQPALQQALGGPTPRSEINTLDVYGWAARVAAEAVRALAQRPDL